MDVSGSRNRNDLPPWSCTSRARRHATNLALGAAVAIALNIVGVFDAWALSTGPLVQISGASPYGVLTECGNFPGQVNGAGTNYTGAEVEPWVDVNPTDRMNIIAVWQQDRWSNGGSRGTVAGVSHDGGGTWTIVPIPGFTDCGGGIFQRASDPWVSFDPYGVAHQMTLVINLDPPAREPGGFGFNGMVTSRSMDGGLTWGDPILLRTDDRARFLNDKNAITADPVDPGYIYAVWDRLKIPQGAVINPERVAGSGLKTELYLARSTDGGMSWEPARKIYGPGGNNETLAHQVLVLPDGTVVDIFNEILSHRNDDKGGKSEFNLALLRSLDKGETWLPHGRPIRAAKLEPVGIVTPDEGDGIRSGASLFDVAVDSIGNSLYAVWQDARFTGFDQIAFSQSSDGGMTWSAPVRVNQTPATPANVLRQQALIPSIAVTDNGTLGVTYYDFRFDDDTGEWADYWLATCSGGCSDPANWDHEVRLTETSFDYALAPVARGLFLGDYTGLVSEGTDFLAVFGQATAPGQSNMYFRRALP